MHRDRGAGTGGVRPEVSQRCRGRSRAAFEMHAQWDAVVMESMQVRRKTMKAVHLAPVGKADSMMRSSVSSWVLYGPAGERARHIRVARASWSPQWLVDLFRRGRRRRPGGMRRRRRRNQWVSTRSSHDQDRSVSVAPRGPLACGATNSLLSTAVIPRVAPFRSLHNVGARSPSPPCDKLTCPTRPPSSSATQEPSRGAA